MRQSAIRQLVNSAIVGACILTAGTGGAFAAKPALVASYGDLTPFSKRLDITFANGFGNGTFIVPAGQLLVIDYISADAGVAPGGNVLFDVATYLAGNEVESHLPMTPQGTILGQAVYTTSAPVHIYADPGSTVTIAFLSSAAGSGGAIVGVYGHLVPTVP